jgi:hypothetical protein
MNKMMKRIGFNLLRFGIPAVLLFALFAGQNIQQRVVPSSPQGKIAQVASTVRTFFTVGTVEAATTPDYVLDPTHADLAWQAALNALPSTGGIVQGVSSGTETFQATVSRAINNVTFLFANGTVCNFNASTPLFSAGTQSYWRFVDLQTDAGGVNYASATNYVLENTTLGATHYSYLTNGSTTAATANITTLKAPTGRGATLIVAAVDATATEKGQADYQATGTNDNVVIQAAIDALPTLGGEIHLTSGTFNLATKVIVRIANGSNGGVWLVGAGIGSTVLNNQNVAGVDAVWWGSGVTNGSMYFGGTDNLSIIGNSASGNGIYYNNFLSTQGIVFNRTEFRANGGFGFKPNAAFNHQNVTIQDCYIRDNLSGGVQTSFVGWRITNNIIWDNTGDGIDAYTNGGGSHYILNNNLEANTVWEIQIANGVVKDNFFGEPHSGGIDVKGSSLGVIIEGNTFGSQVGTPTLIKIEEANTYVGTNYFTNLGAGVKGIQLLSNQATVETQSWGDSDNATAVRITGNANFNIANNVKEQQNTVYRTGVNNYANLVQNGDFEFSTVGWTAGGTGASAVLTSSATHAMVGSKSLKIDSNGGSFAFAQYTIPNYARYIGRWMTLGAWLYAPSTNAAEQSKLNIRDNVGNFIQAGVTADNAWHWVTMNILVSTTASDLYFRFFSTYASASTDILYVDGVTFSEGGTAPSFSPRMDTYNADYGIVNSGTATVTAAATTVVVNHGLSAAPVNIQVTPTNNPTTPIGFYWVDTVTSTQFTINVSGVPGVSAEVFDWRATTDATK